MPERREQYTFRRIRGRIVPIKKKGRKIREAIGETLELGGTAAALLGEGAVLANLHGRKAIKRFGREGAARKMGLTFKKHKTIHQFGRRLGKFGAFAAVAGLALKPEKTAADVSKIGQTAADLATGP